MGCRDTPMMTRTACDATAGRGPAAEIADAVAGATMAPAGIQPAHWAPQTSAPSDIAGLALGAGGLVLGADRGNVVQCLRSMVGSLRSEMERGSEKVAEMKAQLESHQMEMERLREEMERESRKLVEMEVEIERGSAQLASLQEGVHRGCQQLAGCLSQMLGTPPTRTEDETAGAKEEGPLFSEELQRTMEELVAEYSSGFSALASGDSTDDRYCLVLERKAEEALSQIESAMKSIPRGRTARIPLVAMRTFATRARIDAHDMCTPHPPSAHDPPRNHLLRNSMAALKEATHTLLDSHTLTLYTAGILLPTTLSHYLLLHQTLSLSLQHPPPHQPTATKPTNHLPPIPRNDTDHSPWDDGLDVLREFFSQEREGRTDSIESFEIATWADLKWYRKWKQLDACTLVSQFPPRVAVSDIFTEVGLPARDHLRFNPEGAEQLEALKALALPGFRTQAERRLNKALEPLELVVHLVVGDGAPRLPDPRLGYGPSKWRDTAPASALPASVAGLDAVSASAAGPAAASPLPPASVGGPDVPPALAAASATGPAAASGAVPAPAVSSSLAPGGAPLGRADDEVASCPWGGKCIATLAGHKKRVCALAVAPDGSLFSASWDRTIKQWRDGKCVATLTGHTELVWDLAFAPDGTLFSSSRDTTIRQWKEGRCIATLKGHTQWVYALACASDGTLFSGSDDKTIKMWRDGLCVMTLEGHAAGVFALAFAPDGSLFSGSGDGTMKQWRGGDCVATFPGYTRAFAVGSDGSLYSCSSDSPESFTTIRRWREGRCVAMLSGHSEGVYALAVSADGSLFSGSSDATVKQWRDGECVATFRGHGKGVYALTCAPDGSLFSGSQDKTIKQWK